MVGFFLYFFTFYLWLWSLQLCSRLIFSLHRNPNISEGFKAFIKGSYFGFKLDLAWMSYAMILVLLVWVIATASKFSRLFWFIAIILVPLMVFTFIISFADAEMNRVWGSKFNSQALEFMKHPSEALASTSEARWTLVILSTIVLSYFFGKWLFRIIRNAQPEVRFRVSGPVLGVLSLALIAPFCRGGLQTIPINQSNAYYSRNPFENSASVNSSWNFMYYLVNDEWSIDPQKLRFGLQNDSAVEQYLRDSSAAIHAMTNREHPNVVVFVLESFSSFTSDFFGGIYNHTPFLDSLAKTGLCFTHAMAQGDRTAKGLAAVISGWPGQALETKSILTLPAKAARLPGLADKADQAGYYSSFFYGGDLGFDNMGAYLLSSGYMSINGEDIFPDDQKGSKWGAHDQYVFQRAIDSMNSYRRPFFTTILSISSHEPFEIPGKKNEGDEVVKFLNAVSYSDDCIRKFIHRASKQDWFDNTVFVFVADHGRGMGIENMGPFQPRYFKIPIIFWGPCLKDEYKPKRIDRYCSQTDIPKTIAESIFGISDGDFRFSRNLLGNPAPMSYYQMWDGFGVISEKGHVVWNNQTAQIIESSGQYNDLLIVGKSIQWRAGKIFEKL